METILHKTIIFYKVPIAPRNNYKPPQRNNHKPRELYTVVKLTLTPVKESK